jgi:KDO2-lipid IV(A) lauroyltransferase
VRPDLDAAALRALSREGMRSYLRYWCDSFRLPTWTPEQIRSSVRVEGDAPVREALASGRGVVAALSHQGNWDLAGAWSALDLHKVTTVAERLEPVEVFDAFVSYRTRLGIDVLALGDDGVFTTLVRTLRAGGLVPLLCDRDLSRTGLEVDLAGHPARVAAGPASLAEVTGALLVAVTISYERHPAAGSGSGYRTVIAFHDPVPQPRAQARAERVHERTRAVAADLGRGIAAHPQDWHMLQPVFTADLDLGRLARRHGAGPDAAQATAGKQASA